ncbi:DNA recombination protein RmuC [Campylobacter upsaliensis]|uniref:DNA recombination protein RmuC n=1 Tax=Campylobacter upsaliensis TaxID=28080 RepID=UPI000E135433|nr:DNA recombination protein RmuC [Campylobacter upsaliensis]EAI4344827.1 DNA recombination protein RmuC [Campylobacter upsaliensis]EKL1657986.1 DNA recombination protein RmuC [Campylobacter upsaliensis]TXE69355.1 DNA recombination protein RmuC [Campylobacter upsaliensis]CAG9469357.1 DNA recombination protein RmuC [Campylobacter upsaliensis]SUX19645.1 DNA recombination protein RmuC [Campylobacter upsaliensis]
MYEGIILAFILILLCAFVVLYRIKQKDILALKEDNENKKEALYKALLKCEILENSLKEKETQYKEFMSLQLRERENLKQDYKKTLNLLEQKLENNLQKQNLNYLNQNKIMLNEDIKKLLEEIFVPVKKSVKEYSERLSQNEISLQSNIKNMFEYSQNIKTNADKLAIILKGDKKIRGNFAELQLQNILENSGLIKEEQYKLQVAFKQDDKSYIADAIVFLDSQKNIIIDAKFPLPNDFDFSDLNEHICKELAFNLKERIDELSKKPYTKFSPYTYDFILLFIPYQNLLDLALSIDPSLYQYAYKKNIYLTTPNTLFMALNTINISWRHIKSNENILKAFEELGKFHDKFAGVLEDFDKLKNASKSLNTQIENLQNKLFSGTGNLNSRVSKLKDLGAKTQKSLEKWSE